jgi:hypothetical protein
MKFKTVTKLFSGCIVGDHVAAMEIQSGSLFIAQLNQGNFH